MLQPLQDIYAFLTQKCLFIILWIHKSALIEEHKPLKGILSLKARPTENYRRECFTMNSTVEYNAIIARRKYFGSSSSSGVMS